MNKKLILCLILAFIMAGCGAKNTSSVAVTPPAMSVTITQENCPSMEAQVGVQLAWTNGDTVSLPIQLDKIDENGNITATSKSEIGPGDQFSIQMSVPGTYIFYCSDNKDIRGFITVK